jgi:hypothetical protein
MIKISLLLLSLALSGFSASKEIITVPLNPKLVHTLPITESDKGTTTVMFPGPVSAIYPSGVAVDNGSASEGSKYPFVISIPRSDASFFSIKCLDKKGMKGQINVIYNNQIIVIKLIAVELGASSVRFQKSVSPNLVMKAAVTPNLLISAIKKSKRYKQFKSYYPESVNGIAYKEISKTFTYSYHDVTLLEAFRYNNLDTIVFHCTIKNKTDFEIKYNPSDCVSNLKEFFFHSRLTDSSGSVPPKSTTHFYFAIQGSHQKKPLSLSNPWIIIVPINEKKISLLKSSIERVKNITPEKIEVRKEPQGIQALPMLPVFKPSEKKK